MNLQLLRYGAPLVLLVGAACGVEVISDGDDDGEGGEDCGNGGAPQTTGVVTTVGPSSTYATGFPVSTTGGWGTTVTVQGSTVSVTTGGSCPDDPGFQGCGSSSATTGSSGGSSCGVLYCDPNGGPALFERQCSPETMTCTCSSPQGSCECAWNGNCEEPCCGDPPDDPWD